MKRIKHFCFKCCFIQMIMMGCNTLNAQQPDYYIIDSSLTSDTVAPRWEDMLVERLKPFVDEAERSCYVAGICVYDLTMDSLLFAFNQQKMLRPASTQKLLTAIAALDLLGSYHNYCTSIYASGVFLPDSHGNIVLDGSLYVVGDFDPELGETNLLAMARAIREAGIVGVTGNVYADLSMKDSLTLGNGWCWDDKQPYLSPLGLAGDSYKCTKDKINIYSPALLVLTELINCLQADSIRVEGQAVVGVSRPADSHLICQTTHTIGDLLPTMMKDSDNLIAESMFYQLAADSVPQAGWKDCAAIVEQVIKKSGVPTSMVKVADGSGLSLYNYVTPSLQTAMLRYAYHHPQIFEPLYASLPIAGVDGTLEKRMVSGPAYRNVHAKTGTVTGVSSLAGYVTASNGHLLAFSIINNGIRTMAEGRDFQDRVCDALAR